MEQERDGGLGEGGDMNKQLKEMQGDGQVVQSQPVPQQQKCPRCESVNTKFCYYNNYSLSQPRYFCKTCRRYWTHGGTLRNVPFGGGCRKGKRAKNSSSSSTENSSRSHPQPPTQDVVLQTHQPNLTTTLMRAKDPSSAAGSSHVAVPSISPYYQGDGSGYLSSLAAIHSPNPSHPFNQSLNAGVDAVGSSKLNLLSGFNVASLGSSQQHQRQHVRPSQFYQMGGGEREVETLYAPEQGLIPSSMADSSVASHHDWSQTHSFISSANYRASDASLWSTIGTTSINGNSDEDNNASAGSSSLIPNQWPDLPGYGPPP